MLSKKEKIISTANEFFDNLHYSIATDSAFKAYHHSYLATEYSKKLYKLIEDTNLSSKISSDKMDKDLSCFANSANNVKNGINSFDEAHKIVMNCITNVRDDVLGLINNYFSDEMNVSLLTEYMTRAYALKEALTSIPLNIATNSQGNKFVKPQIYIKNLPQIIQEIENFSKDIKNLPFEIPYFDDNCSKSEIIDTVARGLYNVASLCYNKAVLTIYNEIEKFDKDSALEAFSEASLSFDKSYLYSLDNQFGL